MFHRRWMVRRPSRYPLAHDFEAHGEEVFLRVRRESPAAYLKVCAMLVPMTREHTNRLSSLIDEQLNQAIEIIKE
jgi:hypothetical protein